MPTARFSSLALALAVAGCSAGPGAMSSNASTSGKADGVGDALPSAHHCTGGELPSGLETVDWDRWQNELITEAGAGHSARDVLATFAGSARVRGKFAYGPTSKDLEGERVQVWIDDCDGGRRLLGEAVTSGDGRIAFPLEVGDIPGVGIYGITMRVMGDGTTVRSTLRVFPAGTRLVVFDIDATLTTDDLEAVQDVVADLFEPIGAGDYVPEARQGAAEITRLRQSQGYPIVYLTGRPYWLTGISREWLADGGFAPGTLMLTQDVVDVVPTNGHVGDYKADYLLALDRAGFELEAAYGNASTDVYAYDTAGIDGDRTFILGKHGGERGSVALGDGYTDHVPDAADEPLPDQPFTW